MRHSYGQSMAPTPRSVKRALVGRRMPLRALEGELLPRWMALPIFASDPLSSVAYATEAALVVLVGASVASRGLIVPISFVIAALLVVVVLSYRQTIFAYPNGGGSYVVSKENLGATAGLVAAAALLTDYVLTAAVSIASGVLAITSAVPSLASHAVALSLGMLLVLLAREPARRARVGHARSRCRRTRSSRRCSRWSPSGSCTGSCRAGRTRTRRMRCRSARRRPSASSCCCGPSPRAARR